MLFLRMIIVNIMCFFIVISFSVLATAAFTKNIGYKAYGTTSDSSESTELYTYYYADGDDTQKSTFEEQGYKVVTSSIRSGLSKSGNAVFLTVSQIFCLLLTIAFIYPNLWQSGTRDSNLVKFKHKQEDKLKGFKIGLIAAIPFFLFWAFLLAARLGLSPNFPPALYKFLNASFYSVIQLAVGGAVKAGELAVWRILILLLPVAALPLIGWISYLLGYKNISIGEKLVYKKK